MVFVEGVVGVVFVEGVVVGVVGVVFVEGVVVGVVFVVGVVGVVSFTGLARLYLHMGHLVSN